MRLPGIAPAHDPDPPRHAVCPSSADSSLLPSPCAPCLLPATGGRRSGRPGLRANRQRAGRGAASSHWNSGPSAALASPPSVLSDSIAMSDHQALGRCLVSSTSAVAGRETPGRSVNRYRLTSRTGRIVMRPATERRTGNRSLVSAKAGAGCSRRSCAVTMPLARARQSRSGGCGRRGLRRSQPVWVDVPFNRGGGRHAAR